MRTSTQVVTILLIFVSYCELSRGHGHRCVGGGGSCKADSECCSKRCQRISFNNYRCESGNGCRGFCDADSECCSKRCTHISSNSHHCENGNGCVNGGGSCNADSECCSKKCTRITSNSYRCENWERLCEWWRVVRCRLSMLFKPV